jgi:hypothetical protein
MDIKERVINSVNHEKRNKIINFLKTKNLTINDENLEFSNEFMKELHFKYNLSTENIFILFSILGIPKKRITKLFRKYVNSTKESQYKSRITSQIIIYGSTYMSSELGKTRFEKTMLETYGVPNPGLMPDHANKMRATSLEKFGETSYMKTKEAQEKMAKNLQEKYGPGIVNPYQIPEVIEKIQKTNKEKQPSIVKKRKATCEEKYGPGITTPLRKHIKNIPDINEKFWRENFIEDGYFLTEKCQKYHNMCQKQVYNYKVMFGIKEFKKIERNKTEKEINLFLRNFYDGEIILNDRKIIKPLELDFYLPGKNLAIEYNGIMFHSQSNKDNQYHYMFNMRNILQDHFLKKTIECEKLGIQLIHIFDFEWEDKEKREIIKEYIKNLILGKPFSCKWFSKETETEIAIDRRFSDGKFLKLELKETKEPNAMFFNNFVKEHNVPKIFENADEEKMYENGFRKIYDCGILIFRK